MEGEGNAHLRLDVRQARDGLQRGQELLLLEPWERVGKGGKGWERVGKGGKGWA